MAMASAFFLFYGMPSNGAVNINTILNKLDSENVPA